MTYDFNCTKCGNIQIDIHHTKLDTITKCPHCNTPNPTRIYTPLGIVWKCGGNFGKSK